MSPGRAAAFALPAAGFASGRPWRVRGAHGAAYAPIAPELAAAVPRWLATLAVPEGAALKPPDVHRVGELVVKFFTRPSLFGWVRAPRAVRSATRHYWCLPLRSPRPLLAAGRGLGNPSVLVREFVAGRLLSEVWSADAHADEELARFLGRMNAHGVFHGDLHPCNLLWSGSEWVLLDPDGVRHGLHDPRRVLEGQWARFLVHLAPEARVEALFRRARAAAAETGARAVEVEWSRVLARARELQALRARTLGEPER